MIDVMLFYLVLTAMGLAAFPLVSLLLPNLPDRGYPLARVLGLVLTTFLCWYLAAPMLFSYTRGLITACIFIVAVLSLIVVFKRADDLKTFFRRRLGYVLVSEALFLILYLFFALVRAHFPNISGTEQPMDLGLLNGIVRNSHLPPNDPWMTGQTITYYYFGYLMLAMITKLSAVAGGVAYNLSLATLFALAFMGAFSLAYNYSRRYRWAFFGGVCLVGIGNLDGLIQLITERSLIPSAHWWWFRPARVIPADGTTNLITEFPSFSFVLGDLHPHVMAIPLALLAMSVAYNLLLEKKLGLAALAVPRSLSFIILIVLLGMLGTTNSWDYPTYMFLIAVCFFCGQYLNHGRIDGAYLKNVMTLAVPAAALSFFIYFPYYHNFASQAKGLRLVSLRTPFYYLLVLFGLFILIAIAFLVVRLRSIYRERGNSIIKDGKAVWSEIKGAAGEQKSGCPACGADSGAPATYCWKCGAKLLSPEELGGAEETGGLLTAAPVFLLSLFRVPEWLRSKGRWASLLFHRGLEWLLSRVRWTSRLFRGRKRWLSEGRFAAILFRYRERLLGEGRWLVLVAVVVTAGILVVLELGKLIVMFLSLLLVILFSLAVFQREDQRKNLMVHIFFATAFLLVFGCEFLYISDVFDNGPLARMNTLFKLHYQAWMIFSVAAAAAAAYLFDGDKLTSRWKLSVGVCGLVMLLAAAVYFPTATLARAREYSGRATLDGNHYKSEIWPGDYRAARWLARNVKGDPVLLEASDEKGGAYSEYARISVMTGLPIVLGWAHHENQWRGAWPGGVLADVRVMYSTTNIDEAQQLMRKYRVSYVYVGELERRAYSGEWAKGLDKFGEFMRLVYDKMGVQIYYWEL